MPSWWTSRRYGLFVHANLATVPAFSPIGQYADWYRSHLGDPVPDVLLHPSPMVEVLAHHRERWGHIEHFDDFWPLLTFDRFDPDEWAGLASAAGMGYTVFVTKHHDGLCWWDAPGTRRTVLHEGPRRNVLAEYAAACARRGLVFGTYYSLLDWGDPSYPDPDDYVEHVLHRQVLDLVERYGSKVLWGDGHWGHGPDHWRSAELIERARSIQPELVVNDRWWLPDADFNVYEYQTPQSILAHPWELCRGIGHSFGHNRAERVEHHMTGSEIVRLLTEVVAKGGNLLLNVGPALDGTIPDLQSRPLLEAGEWVREHHRAIDGTQPWTTWGDEHVRYTMSAPGVLHAFDLAGAGGFAHLGYEAGVVTGVVSGDGAALSWEQHEGGLLINRLDRTPVGLGAVYHVDVIAGPERLELFSETPQAPVPIAPLLEGAVAGDVVQLGDGTYAGPVVVPPGVTLRGIGQHRTLVLGGGEPAVLLSAGARLEHLRVAGGPARIAWFPAPAVLIGERTVVLGCDVDGHVQIRGDGAAVRASHLAGVVASGVDRVCISRCALTGMRWDVGVEITGGTGHEIDSSTLTGHLCAIRLTDTVGARVRGNSISGRWWAIDLVRSEGAEVVGNSIDRTMRAIAIVGGVDVEVSGNAVVDGDSGCIVEQGAARVVVSGNRWERCRIGLLAWDSPDLRAASNTEVDRHPDL